MYPEMLFSLAACGGDNTPETDMTQDSSASSTEETLQEEPPDEPSREEPQEEPPKGDLSEVEDDVTAYLEFENGATGCFVTTTGDAYGTNRLEIQLDKGKIVIEGGNIKAWEFAMSEPEFSKTTEDPFAKIEKKELVEQIKCALRDEFVARVSILDEQIILEFVCGQKFSVEIKEI